MTTNSTSMGVFAARSRVPRRRLTAEDRRSQLIGVALERFAESGYASTTMDEIATAAGVTKPLLYQHFASKRALYLELIDEVTADLVGALARASQSESSARGKLEAGFRAYFRFVLDHQAATQMLYDPPRDEELARGLRTVEDAIAEYITPLFLADVSSEHQRVLAVAVVGMAEGVARHWLRERHERGPIQIDATSESECELYTRRVAHMAWNGLRALQRID